MSRPQERPGTSIKVTSLYGIDGSLLAERDGATDKMMYYNAAIEAYHIDDPKRLEHLANIDASIRKQHPNTNPFEIREVKQLSSEKTKDQLNR